jgi:hypothetical protein
MEEIIIAYRTLEGKPKESPPKGLAVDSPEILKLFS